MATKHDKDVIERFLHEYNAERQTSFKVVAWPDDIDRSGKAIDALASDGTAALGIEHTLLQPFTGERQDTAVFLKTVATLDKVPHLMLPNVSVTLSFEVAAVPKGVDWSSIAPAVEQWYLNIRQQLPEGRCHHVIASLPFTLEVIVDRTSLKHPRGFFFISRQMPTAKPLVETVEQALKMKVDKLTAASADRRVLLLEKDIPIYGNGEVGELLEQLLPQFPKLANIDEVCVADTSGLHIEDYFVIDLVWPLDDALERDYARNETA